MESLKVPIKKKQKINVIETEKKHKKKRKKTRIPGIQEENRTTVWKINFYIGKQEKKTKKK